MAEPSPSADPPSTDQPETAGAEVGTPDEGAVESRFKQKKLLVVLGATAFAGLLLGVGSMLLLNYLQPASPEHRAPPPVTAPVPDRQREVLADELKELRAKNEKLEEQLKLAAQPAPVSAPAHDAAPLPTPTAAPEMAPVAEPVPSRPISHHRSTRASRQEKVTADCTVPDKDARLGEKLKSCIEDFNASTR